MEDFEHKFEHYLQGHIHPDVQPEIRREVQLEYVSMEAFLRLAGLFDKNHRALDEQCSQPQTDWFY